MPRPMTVGAFDALGFILKTITSDDYKVNYSAINLSVQCKVEHVFVEASRELVEKLWKAGLARKRTRLYIGSIK